MKIINRYGLMLLGIMSVAIPLWLTIGKAIIFSAGGWGTLVYIYMYAPIIFVMLWIFFIILILRNDVRDSRTISSVDSMLLIAIYISLFLHGVFLVDGGDTPKSINSVAMNVFGLNQNISSELSSMFALATIIFSLIAFVVFIIELVRTRPPQAI